MGPTVDAERWLWRSAVALFAVAVLVLPLALAVRFVATSGWWWERGFDQFDAEARTGLPRAEVDRGAAELRAYFGSDEEFVDVAVVNRAGEPEPLFSQREILHLRDVKRLLDRTYDAGSAALGFIVAFVAGTIAWRRAAAARVLAAAAFAAGGAVIGVIGVLAIIVLSGFDGAFHQFHLLFFTNDLWQLTLRDRLIQLFPQDFFFESTMLIGVATVGTALALALAGWLARRRNGGLTAVVESADAAPLAEESRDGS